jgi:transposase-like protein
MTISFKGAHFPKEVILMGVRWYVAYPLSTRHVEELMAERGVDVDHSHPHQANPFVMALWPAVRVDRCWDAFSADSSDIPP